MWAQRWPPHYCGGSVCGRNAGPCITAGVLYVGATLAPALLRGFCIVLEFVQGGFKGGQPLGEGLDPLVQGRDLGGEVFGGAVGVGDGLFELGEAWGRIGRVWGWHDVGPGIG